MAQRSSADADFDGLDLDCRCSHCAFSSGTIDRDDSSLQPWIQFYHDTQPQQPLLLLVRPSVSFGSPSPEPLTQYGLRIDIVGYTALQHPNPRFVLTQCFPDPSVLLSPWN